MRVDVVIVDFGIEKTHLIHYQKIKEVEVVGVVNSEVISFKNKAVTEIETGCTPEWGFAKEEIIFATDKIVCEIKGPLGKPLEIQYVHRDKPAKIYIETFSHTDGFFNNIEHSVGCLICKSKPYIDREYGVSVMKSVLL